MYKKCFGLTTSPFKLTPDTHFFFSEGKRKTILDALIYVVGNGDGITKVIGEVGSGKTLLSRLLAQSLPDNFEVLYLLNPRIPPDKILYAIAVELGLEVNHSEDKVALLHALHNQLLALHHLNKQTVLLIDEAQAIPLETLEELRMLSNLETSSNKLLQMVLFGQPELDHHLNRHEVRQIKERIIHSFYLPKLTRAEVARYLAFRLQKAGYLGDFPFSPLAVNIIARVSDGILRRINVLADKCLLAAFSRQTKAIGLFLVLKVIFERSAFTKNALVIVAVVLSVVAGLMIAVEAMTGQHTIVQVDTNADRNIETAKITIKPEKSKPVAKQHSVEQPHAVQVQTQKGYAIQLMQVALKKTETAKSAIARMIPADMLSQIFFFENDSGVYDVIVFMGVFTRLSEAKLILEKLPATLKQHKPFIIKTGKIYEKYHKNPEIIHN